MPTVREYEAALAKNPADSEAFIGLRKGYSASDDLAKDLIEHCKTNMAPYKRPRWIEFMNELPKTATGKIQRSALRYTIG